MPRIRNQGVEIPISTTVDPLRTTVDPLRVAALESRLASVESRLVTYERQVGILLSTKVSGRDPKDTSDMAAEVSGVSHENVLLLAYMSTEEGSVRYADLLSAAVSLRVVTSDPAKPQRAYNALHARLSSLHRKGYVKKTSWGRWLVTDRGRVAGRDAVPTVTSLLTMGGESSGAIDTPTGPSDDEVFDHFQRTGQILTPPTRDPAEGGGGE